MKLGDVFQTTPVQQVQDYWNNRPCNIRHSPQPVGTREYFDEVEARKHFVEPHIPTFAEFEHWKKGFGNWLRYWYSHDQLREARCSSDRSRSFG